MAVADEAQRALFTRLVGVLGEVDAVTLTDQLPPSGEVMVTKSHLDMRLDALEQRISGAEQRLDQRISGAEQRISGAEQRISAAAELDARMQALHARGVRVFVTAVVISNATIAALAVTVGG